MHLFIYPKLILEHYIILLIEIVEGTVRNIEKQSLTNAKSYLNC